MIAPLRPGYLTATPASRGPAPSATSAEPAPEPTPDQAAPPRPAVPEMSGRKAAEVVFGSRRQDDRIAWQVDLGARETGWPEVSAGGNVLVSNDDGVACLKPDGDVAWRSPRAAWTHSRPAPTPDGGCVWSPGSGGLVALDAEGRQKWHWGQGQQMQSIQAAVGPDGTSYVCVKDQGYDLAAVGPDGATRWRASLDMHASSPAVVHPDGKVSVRVDLYDETKVVTFDSRGQKTSEASIPGRVEGRLGLGPDGSVWVGNQDGQLFRVKPDGQADQVFQARGAVRAMPRVEADGRILFGTMDGLVYSLNPDGSQAWQAEVGGLIESRVERMADGTILVGDFHKRLTALTPDGQEKWQMPLDFAAEDAMTVAPDGTVYLAGASQVMALREGGIKADLDTLPQSSTPPAGEITRDDGWIVVGDVKLPVRT